MHEKKYKTSSGEKVRNNNRKYCVASFINLGINLVYGTIFFFFFQLIIFINIANQFEYIFSFYIVHSKTIKQFLFSNFDTLFCSVAQTRDYTIEEAGY